MKQLIYIALAIILFPLLVIIELTKNNLPLDIIINITKFKCHYIVIKRKERRDMYGFY